VIDSFETEEIAARVRKQLNQTIAPAGFHIRRWCSNSIEVLNEVPEEDRAEGVMLEDAELPKVKTLGVWWNAKEDQFQFVTRDLNTEVQTKRQLLSKIATTFDPFQFLSPVIIRGKMVLQEAWFGMRNFLRSCSRL
jgi:hypothetical protein